jgi:thioredoxin reductase (NADPH)
MAYDFIIIGGGAAGLTAALYAARSKLKTLVLEEALAGGQVQNILELENYPAVMPAIGGFEFSALLEKQAKAFGTEIIQSTVKTLEKSGDEFTVKTGAGEFTSPAVLLSTGASPRKLGVADEEKFTGRGVSYCATCDGPFFRGKRIAVIGGGNSACDEALYLATLSDDVTIIHRKSTFRAEKTVADRVLNNKHITGKFDTIATEIQGDVKVASLTLQNTKTGATESFPVAGVFIFAGSNPRTNLVSAANFSGGVKTDNSGYIVTDENMQTSVSGLFCAGDVRSKPFRQVITAASDGAIAAHSAGKYILELKGDVYQ